MSAPINNACNRLLTENSGTVPEITGGVLDYFQQMVFSSVKKKFDNYKVSEVSDPIYFKGVWQPYSDRNLSMKPEGQRSWQWVTLHALVGLILNPDDVVTYLGTQYRVVALQDYSLYGYVIYHLVNDYTGSGPS